MTTETDAPAASSPAFASFELDERILSAVADLGFETPTPIQEEAIPVLLDGRDVIGRARTGSGKTAAFGLPLLQAVRDGGPVRALVLAPTRELALQVTKAMQSYATRMRLEVTPIYGGAPYEPQLRALRHGATVVVGTPGRLIDHLDRGSLDLSTIEMVVLDEADEMLRMGFIEDVERLLEATPDGRQVALFSATMPRPIRRVANKHLSDPVEVQVEEEALAVDHIGQRWMLVPQRHKLEALLRVLHGVPRGTTLVFARTRRACAQIADALAGRGLAADALHGDLNQAARERVLGRLRAQRLDVVVATDVAARGIDVEHLSLVVNLDLPDSTETYVHRIGRTGRAGREGAAISLVTPAERRQIRQMQRTLGVTIEQVEVPTDADIARRQRAQVLAQLAEAIGERDLTGPRAWLVEEADKAGWDLADLAAAAVLQAADAQGMKLGAVPEERPVHWSRPTERPQGRPDDTTNEVEIFVPVGRRAGLRPSDLVGAIANEAGIPGREIGRISIFSQNSFVGVPRAVAEHVLKHHPTMEIRGMEVELSLAKGGPSDRVGREGERNPRGPRQDGPPGRGPRRDGPPGGDKPPRHQHKHKRWQSGGPGGGSAPARGFRKAKGPGGRGPGRGGKRHS